MDVVEVLTQVLTALQQIHVTNYLSEEIHVDCVRAIQSVISELSKQKEGGEQVG